LDNFDSRKSQLRKAQTRMAAGPGSQTLARPRSCRRRERAAEFHFRLGDGRIDVLAAAQPRDDGAHRPGEAQSFEFIEPDPLERLAVITWRANCQVPRARRPAADTD
jgi:hypothetical protein